MAVALGGAPAVALAAQKWPASHAPVGAPSAGDAQYMPPSHGTGAADARGQYAPAAHSPPPSPALSGVGVRAGAARGGPPAVAPGRDLARRAATGAKASAAAAHLAPLRVAGLLRGPEGLALQ